MRKFSTLGLVFTILFLFGCNLPSTQKSLDAKENTSSFYLEDVSGDYAAENFMTEISIPKSRVYAMKACLKDLKFSKKIAEHSFKIEELDLEIKTDNSGCLNWNEMIDFDFLLEPTFLTLSRKITSMGIHQGSIDLKFAVNPWDIETYKSIVNMEKNTPTPLLSEEETKLKLQGEEKNLKPVELWVEDGRLFVNEEKLGTPFQLRYEFNLTPTLKIKKTSQESALYNLKFGKFIGKIEVVQNFYDGNTDLNKFEIIAENTFNDALLDKGTLTISRILEFATPPTRGNIFLRLYLKPKFESKNIKSFVGIFPLGEANNLRNNSFLKVLKTPELTEKMEKALPTNWTRVAKIQVGSSDESVVASRDSSKADSIITVLPFTITPVRGDGITSHRRTMVYNVESCFTNNLTKMPVNFQDFTVTSFSTDEAKPGKTIQPLKSNVAGCLFWTDKIEYDIYECHHYFKGYVILENKHLNIRVKRYYNVNPWSDYFIGIDDSKISDKIVTENRCIGTHRLRSEIDIDGIAMNSLFINYPNSINSMLEWNVKRNFGIELRPKVKVPSHLEQGIKHIPEPMIDGYYLLRMHILKNMDLNKNPELIYHKDLLVSHRSGHIYVPIEISFQDQRFFSTRNSVFIQLLPIKQNRVKELNPQTVVRLDESESLESLIDKESPLVAPIFYQPFVLGSESAISPMVAFSNTFLNSDKGSQNSNDSLDFEKLKRDFYTKNQQHVKSVNEISKIENFASLNALTLTQPQNFNFGQYVQKALKTKKLAGEKEFLNQLCNYWFSSVWNGKLNLGEFLLKKACSKAADSGSKGFFEFNHIYKIHKIRESDKVAIGTEKNISIASGFSIVTTSTDYITGQLGIGSKVGSKAGYSTPGKSIFPSVGAEGGIEISAQLAKGTQRSFSESNSISLNESTSLHVHETQFKIRPESYTYCLSIRPNPRLFTASGKMILFEFWDGDIDYGRFFKAGITETEKMLLFKKGFLFCNSAPENEPTQLVEQYYWIFQSFDCSEVQDCKEEQNKAFTFMVRGNQDYARFKYFLTKNWIKPESSAQSKNELSKYTNQLQLLDKFNKILPGFYMYSDP